MTTSRFMFLSVLLVLLGTATGAFAQGVGINTTGAAADTSAILDLTTTAKGFLPPRMTTAQRSAIALPATGLLVYQTDGTTGLYYNAGTPVAPNWKQVLDSGSGGTSQWTTNGTSIYYNLGNVGIQRPSPLARLDVLGGNWDVVNGEGDFRIGDGSTRLKIGLATGGGGTGAATIMEQGAPGAYNVLALGTQGNKVLHVNGNSQRVGIGTDAPTAPLGFAATTGKKITLYPGSTGDYGFGIGAGRLQIFTENAGTDVAIGSDAAGTFTERLAVRNNGAIAVTGNAGLAGQVLQSTGPASPPTWGSPTQTQYGGTYILNDGTNTSLNVAGVVALPGLTQTISFPATVKVLVSYSVSSYTPQCTFCGVTNGEIQVLLDGAGMHENEFAQPNYCTNTQAATVGALVGPGTHTISISARLISGPPILFGASSPWNNQMIVQVIPQ